MGTLTIQISSGNLESYEALFLQLPDPVPAEPIDRLDLAFGDVTQVFPSAFALLAAYVSRARDRAKKPLVTRRFGANPQSAKLERAMDAVGFLPAVLGNKPTQARSGSLVIPLLPIQPDSVPEAVAAKVLDQLVNVSQPTRDAKECLFVILGELVENVRLHSQGEAPAFLCGQLSAQKKKLELVLVDCGIGVKASFEGGKDDEALQAMRRGRSALSLALEAGRTAKGPGNSGYGLYVASAAARFNRGVFRLTSGGETVIVSREGEKHRTHSRWSGTVVNLLFNLDRLGTLGEVYRSLPLPFPEKARFLAGPEPKGAEVVVALKGEGPYLGSRAAAAEKRAQLLQAARSGSIAVADLEGVTAASPAYADALFGELFEALGEDAYRASVVVRSASESLKPLIESVLERRAPARAEEPEPEPVLAPDGAGSDEAAEPVGAEDAEPVEPEAAARESGEGAGEGEDERAALEAGGEHGDADEPAADEAEDDPDRA